MLIGDRNFENQNKFIIVFEISEYFFKIAIAG